MSGIQQVWPTPELAGQEGPSARITVGMHVANRLWPISLVLVSLLLFLLNTRHGIGILPDSTRYLGLAPSQDAPLYSWVLAAVTKLGLTRAQSAEMVGLILACINPLLIWQLLARMTRRPAYAAVGTALIIFAPTFVALHAAAMSEPLFLCFIFLSLLTLLRFWETADRRWLIACSIAIGVAGLTRFTAPPLGAAIAIGLLLDRRVPFGRRVVDVVILAALSSAIFLSWSLLSQMVAGHSLGRTLAFNGNMGAKAWHTSLVTLLSWLVPSQVPDKYRLLLSLLAAICSAALVFWQISRTVRRTGAEAAPERLLPAVLTLFLPFYLVFFFVAASIEANQTLVPRYALPIYVTTILLMTIVIAEARGVSGVIGRLQTILIAVAALVLVGNVVRTAQRTHQAYAQGVGYSSLAWMRSPTMQAVAHLPANTTIYTNAPDAIAYVLRRHAVFIPMLALPRTGHEDPAHPFAAQIYELRNDPNPSNKVFVFFNRVDWRFYLPTEARLQGLLQLKLRDRESDGRIYTLPLAAAGDAKP